MKRTATFLCVISLINFFFAQVAIGKQQISSESVSLEFGSDNRGLILPWIPVSVVNIQQEPGSLFLTYNPQNQCGVFYRDNFAWTTLDSNNGTINTSLQDSENENENAKVSIGAPSSVPGILVLEDNNKAMILPKVASPHLNIIKPEPGTIAFDTVKQQLAVFNGTEWSFC